VSLITENELMVFGKENPLRVLEIPLLFWDSL